MSTAPISFATQRAATLRQAERLIAFGEANPITYVGAIATALIAPLFMKNDERGYFKTATLTTPAIIAAAMVAPRLMPTLNREGRRMIDVVKKVPESYGFKDGVRSATTGITNMPEAQKGLWSGTLPIREHNAALRDYLIRPEVVRDIEAEADQVDSLQYSLQKHFGVRDRDLEGLGPAKDGVATNLDYFNDFDAVAEIANANRAESADTIRFRMLDNAFAHADRVGMGAVARVEAGELPAVAPVLSFEDMQRAIDRRINSGKPEDMSWIKEMNYRMREIKTATIRNGAITPLSGLPAEYDRTLKEFAYNALGKEKLDKETAGLLDALLADKSVTTKFSYLRPENIQVLCLPAEPNSPIMEVRGFRFKNGRRSLEVGLTGKDGRVFVGKNLEHAGISRRFFSGGKYLKSEHYIIEAMHEGMSHATAEAHIGQILQGRDPTDAWSNDIGEGVSQALGRHQKVGYSTYLMGNNQNSFAAREGDLGKWSKMDPSRQMEIRKERLAAGDTDMLGGTNNRKMQMRGAQRAVPFGMQPEAEELGTKAAKSPVWAELGEESTIDKLGGFGGRNGFAGTDYFDTPSVGLRKYMMAPKEQALWASLPDLANDPEFDRIQTAFRSQALARNSGNEDRTTAAIEKLDAEEWFTSRRQRSRFLQAIADKKDAAIDRFSFETFFERSGHRARFIAKLQEAHQVSADVATGYYNKMLPMLANSETYNTLRRTASGLGDGSIVAARRLNVSAVRSVRVTGSEPLLPDSVITGDEFVRGTPIVMHDNVPVLSRASRSRVADVTTNLADQTVSYNIQETEGVAGMKFGSPLGKTVASQELSDNEMDLLRGAVNKYQKITGQSGFMGSEVNAIGSQMYGTKSAKQPIAVLNDMVSDQILRSERLGHSTEAWLAEKSKGRTFAARMKELGYTLQNGQLILDSNKVIRTQANTNASNAIQLLEDLMKSAGERVRKGMMKGDAVLEHFAAQTQEPSLIEYMARNANPETAQVMGHMNYNIGEGAAFTWDVAQQLVMSGHADVVKEITARADAGGDRADALDFVRRNDPSVRKMNVAPPEGSTVIPFKESGIGLDMSLSTAEGRVFTRPGKNGPVYSPTVFDPKHPLTEKPYYISAEVAGHGQVYIPVPGRSTFGGETNPYTEGYSATDWERNLQKLGRNIEETNAGTATATPFKEAFDTYVESYTHSASLGKSGFLRASVLDREAVQAHFSARESTLQYADKSINPFQVGLSDRHLAKFSQADAKTLFEGGAMYGPLVGHPAKNVPLVQYVYDPRLNGTDMFGVTPAVEAWMGRDNDGDAGAAMLAHGGVSEHVKATVLDQQSIQVHRMKNRRIFGGNDFDAERAVLKADGIVDLGKAFAMKDIANAQMAKTAGGAVGMLSNTNDLIQTMLEHSSAFTDPFKRATMSDVMFDLVRQSVIAAQKLKKGTGFGNMAEIMGWNSEINKYLRQGSAGGKGFTDTMMQGALLFGKPRDLMAEDREFFGMTDTDFAAGRKINPYEEFIKRNQQDMYDVPASYDRRVAEIKRMSMLSDEAIAAYEGDIASKIGEDLLPIQQASLRHPAAEASAAGLGAKNAATAATETTVEGVRSFAGKAGKAARGTANQAMSSAERILQAAHSESAGKVLALGAAVAAGAGILFGSIHSPREGQALAPESGNHFRPEEEIGVDGHIPGEPDAGAMAPANPPRRIRPAQQGVRTAVVAPMGRTTELEVRMKGEDRDRSAEAARLASRIAAPSGNSNTHVTYRDTTRLDSLRTRGKIREALDERT
jgi:hypothetical protein